MDLDFLEIGTSNFDTCIQTYSDDKVGISVEPLKFYLDELPDRPNVKKVHAAITHNKPSNVMNIFYIPADIIDKQNLPQWFKGCNKIGNYHPLHVKHNVKQFVNILETPLLNVDEFMEMYNVRKIKFLKIDTEGHDPIILQGFYEFLVKKGVEYYPSKIQFESNEHTPSHTIDRIVNLFSGLGYKLVVRGYDTLLEY